VVFGDGAAVDTTASFSEADTYMLRLTADDGEYTVGDEVTVVISEQGSYIDNFNSNTTFSYMVTDIWAAGGVGSFSYDANRKQALVQTGDNIGLKISKTMTFTDIAGGSLMKFKLIIGIAIYLSFMVSGCNFVLSENAPYPKSPIIEKLIWASPKLIVRKAEGSDCWPITWADDGHLYTAYGDGWGFEPKVPEKLSMGFAVIKGEPNDFTGVNIRSEYEQFGQGKNGKKPSGLIMIDGILYMLVRNADKNGRQSELWFSENYGKDWKSVGWRFEHLGYPTFINYGRNNDNAIDDFVYIISPDGPSAYTATDRFVLARCHRASLRQANSWEYFTGLNPNGKPVWSLDFSRREGVFQHQGNCLRSGISYNAGLGRYIWWQQNGGNYDTRFKGGFGIFDAPEPWGPWTTVFSTSRWDVGPGETGSFPPKWMSADGKTMHLVFSGDDYFSVRKATLILAPLAVN
jgi:hypothetical protein